MAVAAIFGWSRGGRYQNLAHTVVNGQIAGFGDHRGPTPFNTFPPPPGGFVNRIETMYPFLFAFDAGGQATPHADDIAIFSTLYPEPTFSVTTGTIAGNIVAPNNTTPLTGVNVIARNVLNPYEDAVSAISSDFTDNFTSGQPFVGAYTLRGLTPGASCRRRTASSGCSMPAATCWRLTTTVAWACSLGSSYNSRRMARTVSELRRSLISTLLATGETSAATS